jgi:sugar/nucleoside kinase (ribokinase family)
MAVSNPNSCRVRGLFVGLATVDLVYVVDDLPPRNAKISVPGQHIAAGGPATNAAATFAFFGGSSALVTAVGQHPLGAVIRQDLDRFSVSVYDVTADRQEIPPVSSILVVRGSGERTVVSADANAFPPLAFEVDPDWLNHQSIVLVDGHYMRMCITAAQYAHSRGIPVVLEGGSWKEGMAGLLPHVDIAICSDDFRPPACQDDMDVLEFLAGQGISRVAITRGAAPISYVEEGTAGEIPIKQVHAIDTLGAGDIFHGAFCYSACQPGHAFVDSLAFAARVATFSCQYLGTRLWMDAFSRGQAIQS